jgi:hypothetical protein
MTTRPTGFENKHLEVPQVPAIVDLVTNQYGMFFWEVAGTQTIVAKESHLESGEYNQDNLYSVTTTERFVAIDLRRATDTPNLSKIKDVERQYFQISAELSNLGASPLDKYASPPGMAINWKSVGLLLIFFWPALVWYFYSKNKKLKQAIASWQSLKPRLDALIGDNRSILNLAS